MSHPLYGKTAPGGSARPARPLTFPDILCDPLIRMVMAADRVDAPTLKAELRAIAASLSLTPAESPQASPCGC